MNYFKDQNLINKLKIDINKPQIKREDALLLIQYYVNNYNRPHHSK